MLRARRTVTPALGLGLLASCLLWLACRAPLSPEELANAQLYFPPRHKYVEEIDAPFTRAERERALRAYGEQGANTLYELVVDPDGQVVRARLVRTRVKRADREFMLDHARRMHFSPEPEGRVYRAFYFPVDYTLEKSFEWL